MMTLQPELHPHYSGLIHFKSISAKFPFLTAQLSSQVTDSITVSQGNTHRLAIFVMQKTKPTGQHVYSEEKTEYI